MAASVVIQARVPQEVAETLRHDIDELGLAGVSEAIRDALVLLHRKAQLKGLGQAYDDFYEDGRAPLSDVTAALYPDEQGSGSATSAR